jgi:transcriptional antiterminator
LKQLLWRYSDGHSVTYIHGKPLTVPLLAEKLKVSDRQIQKCLKKLEDQKEIVRIPHRGRGGYLEIRIGPNYGTMHEQR